MLRDEHKKHRMASTLSFLECYRNDDEQFLYRIIMEDKTTAESKQHNQWPGIIHDCRRNSKNSSSTNESKIYATIFLDGKSVLLVDFMAREEMINAKR